MNKLLRFLLLDIFNTVVRDAGKAGCILLVCLWIMIVDVRPYMDVLYLLGRQFKSREC